MRFGIWEHDYEHVNNLVIFLNKKGRSLFGDLYETKRACRDLESISTSNK